MIAYSLWSGHVICVFRLIVSDGQPLLASGGSSGVISIWNLERRRLQSVIREAHDGSIISLHFFANEPVLMSSSDDNSIKVRAFVLSFSVLDGNTIASDDFFSVRVR